MSEARSTLGVGSPRDRVSGNSVVPSGTPTASPICRSKSSASGSRSSLTAAVDVRSWTIGVSVWVPPAVAVSFVTVVRWAFSFFGTTTIVFAATLPVGPIVTASTPTFSVEGMTTNLPSTIPISAGGRVISAVVRNSIPDSVLTIEPLSIVFELPVSRLENVTSPVAVVSVTLTPVAGNVLDAPRPRR